MKALIKGIGILMLGISLHVQAYPGMQKQAPQAADDSRVNLIKVLPQTFPITPVAFKDAKGNPTDFSQYKGKVVMVNMWATWCPPCVRELPAIARLEKKFSNDDFVVLPISIDRNGKEKVAPFLKSMGMENFTTYYDSTQELGEVFPLDTIPATFILNQKGELVAYVRTFVDWDADKAKELIQSFIKP